MNSEIQILMLEDQPADAALIDDYLRRSGLRFHLARVETRDQFEQAIQRQHPDLILSDHGLPAFDSLAAFSLARQKCPEVPFIVVTGSAWDDMTLEALKRGADAFVAKDQLSHLVPKVKRSLQKVEKEEQFARLNEELKKSEEHFRMLFESARDYALVTVGMDHRITCWSSGAFDIFGYPEAEILNQHPRILFTPEDRASGQSEKELKAALANHHVEDERWHLRKNGQRFWGSGMTMLLRDPSGQPRGFLKVLRDLTDRHLKQLEDQARIRQQAALARFGQYAVSATKREELTTKALWIVAETMEVDYAAVLEWQPKLQAFQILSTMGWAEADWGQFNTGAAPYAHALYTLQQNRSVTVDDFDSEQRFQFQRAESLAAKSGVGVIVQNALQAFDLFLVHSKQQRHFNENEVQFLQSMANVLADALHRRHIEEALRKSEERFRLAVEGVQEYAIYMLDAEGRVATYNVGAERLEGYRAEEIIGQPLAVFFPPEDVAKGMPEQELARARNEGRSQTEGWCVRKDGSRFLSDWVLTSVFDESGKFAGYCKVARDVTTIKEAEAQSRRWNAELEERVAQRTRELRGANQELEAFNYSVSHDLRAPLRHINAFVSILQRTAANALSPQQLEYLNIISQSAQQLGALVDDLLTFSRMGRQEMRRVPVRLSWLVEEAQKQLIEEMNHREIEWVISDLPTVEGDPVTLRQVFINLLSNALKYTSSRPRARIEVKCESSESETICHVGDNGVGFDMQYADKLFGVFQRLHSSQEFEGTGIGLAIVQRVIQRHGGRVWAEAEVDKGAAFYFTLPKKTKSGYEKEMDSDRGR